MSCAEGFFHRSSDERPNSVVWALALTEIILRDHTCPKCQSEKSLRTLLQRDGPKVSWIVFCEKCDWKLFDDSDRSVSRIEVDIPSYAETWRQIRELRKRIEAFTEMLKVQSKQVRKSKPGGIRKGSESKPAGESESR